MANSVEPINHDGLSTVSTVGGKVAKWGALGFLAAAAVGFGLATLGVGVVGALLGLAVDGASFGSFAGAMFSGGAATWLIGLPAAVAGAFTGGGYGVVGGGVIGALKGADKVSKESNAFRRKVEERLNGRENKAARQFNDGEIKGIEEGYAIAMQDIQPRIEAARQEGAQMVVEQIQQHMQAQSQMPAANAAEKKFAGEVVAEAKCKAVAKCPSKVDALIQERATAAAATAVAGPTLH